MKTLISLTIAISPVFTFGQAGVVITPIGSANDQGRVVVIQPDGKMIVAGHSDGTDFDFAVVRYNADGSLDGSFGNGGTVVTNINGDDNAFAVALQPDGKIVVVGLTHPSASTDFAMVRYNSNGTLDSGFGTAGKVTTSFGGNDVAYDVAIQPDGKIVVAGYSAPSGSFDFAVARYTNSGALDVTFGSGGKVTTNITDSDAGTAVAIQSDYKIVVAGYTKTGLNDDFALVRYNVNGSLDNTFDSDGKLNTEMGTDGDYAEALSIQPDGKIIAAGYSDDGTNKNFALARYNMDGSLDTTFGSSGIAIRDGGTDGDAIRALALQSDGKIVASGTSTSGLNKFTLARFNTDGSFDNTFDTDGKLITFLGTGDYANGVAIQADGKIVAAGYTRQGTTDDFVLVRYLPNGALDFTLDVEALRVSDGASLNVYPNPAKDVTHLEYMLPNDATVAIELRDLTGRTLATFVNGESQSAGAHETQIGLPADLAPGVYMIVIHAQSWTGAVRVVR